MNYFRRIILRISSTIASKYPKYLRTDDKQEWYIYCLKLLNAVYETEEAKGNVHRVAVETVIEIYLTILKNVHKDITEGLRYKFEFNSMKINKWMKI